MNTSNETDNIVKNLLTGDRSTRRRSAQKLGDLADLSALNSLASALFDSEVSVREAAGDALIKIGGKPVIAAVIPTLRSESEPARNLACEVLEAIGHHDVMLISNLLNDPDGDVRKFIADILGKINDKQSLPALIKALQDSNPNVVTSAIESLGKTGDSQAVEPLISMLSGPFSFECALALGELHFPSSLEALFKIAEDKNNLARYAAIESIGKLGDKSALPRLMELLNERHLLLQKTILKMAGMIDESWLVRHVADFRSLWLEDCFWSALSDDDELIKRAAIISLGALNYADAASHLLNLFTDKNESLLDHLILSLGKIGKSNFPSIVENWDTYNERVKTSLCFILGNLQDPRAVSYLVDASHHESGLVRSSAIRALSQFNPTENLSVFISALNDSDDEVKFSAVDALGLSNFPETIDQLAKLECGEALVFFTEFMKRQSSTTRGE